MTEWAADHNEQLMVDWNLLEDIVAAEPLRGYRLHLKFEDGVGGVVDLAHDLSFGGIFRPMRDTTWFAQVQVNPELGTVTWPNGADLDLGVLYSRITGCKISLAD